MTDMHPLLIELGTEELPVKALPGLATAFFDGVLAALDKRGVAVERGDAKPLYTPRRLAVLLPGVATEQPEQRSEVLGPYLNIALDADGNPTKALQGFAAKAGIDWTALEKTRDAKGERFVHRAVTPGATTAALLPDVLREAIAAMPIPKPMRWGAHAYAFARPVHWLVLLHGTQVIDAELFGVRGGRTSRGHRFMHDRAVEITAPGDYVDAMRSAKVLVDADARRARIVDEVEGVARALGGDARIEPDNLEQVNCLVEWPKAVACTFEHEFLAVPQEALIATMEANQKFFPVLQDGRLTEHFIGIANIESRDPIEVAKGYERVIRPRFADAKFFFDEDLKQGLSAMNDGLKTVTYQARLGSVADKTARVAALAEVIAPQVGVDAALARRAALLSKADLQSRMVGEFPELQGIAGRYYAKQDPALSALSDADRAALANALDEAWQPRFAGDDIALSPLGKVLAIAERLDTLAGGFAAGLKPTGNKDAFALRRNALGLARTLIESGFDLDLQALLAAAIERVGALPTGKDGASAYADRGELYDFILDRLKGYYADKGVTVQQFNAVAALQPPSLYDLDRRIDAIGTFAALPEAEALAAADKRIRNILRKADIEIPDTVDPALLREPAEAALAEAVEAVHAETAHALAQRDYVSVLTHLARLRPQVDAFFDGVMVNADDASLRANRLALLKRLSERLGSVAAIEHLSS
ncbi:glycine--tRNA ligase subunit beta [Lysobacteraceae bacterium NML93-0792]|nr:glycine--tRNA ligase subunit beta [Xanthomonadaceae bacterium NML93-0792]PBS15045.1 glycine--tRNA ligase subunit beta [Xanthomonadaceae bacterium NML93-0793]PBS17864.1 glycine--tRNA ligase subunit beta [Xanthomonadaceae bacterium NML93-0831]